MAQDANEVANKSVGEKALPLPLLSVGASVMMVFPDFKCLQVVRRFPK